MDELDNKLYISNGDIGLLNEYLGIAQLKKVNDTAIQTENSSLEEFLSMSIKANFKFYYDVTPKLYDIAEVNIKFGYGPKLLDIFTFKGKAILFLVLSDKGLINDVGGTGEDRDDVLFSDFISFYSSVLIESYDYITWKHEFIHKPYLSLLYFGHLLHFKDEADFSEFTSEYFKDYGFDDCPVCGEKIKGHLKFGFFDVDIVPHNYYLCSKDCLRKFMAKRMAYTSLLANR